MAFQNLKPGSTVYIFRRTEDPALEIGQVVGDIEIVDKYPMPTQPSQFPNYPNFTPTPQSTEKIVNLNLKLEDGKQIPIKKLSPTADIEDCGNGVLVSCSREAINAEIVAYKQISDMALADATLNAHRTIIKNCAVILSRLNPEIAERQAAEKEKQEMKKELNELKGMVRTLLEQLGSPQNK